MKPQLHLLLCALAVSSGEIRRFVADYISQGMLSREGQISSRLAGPVTAGFDRW